jgi:hypothetical protein
MAADRLPHGPNRTECRVWPFIQAVTGDCGRCRRPGLGISTTIPSPVCSSRFSRWSLHSTSLAWSNISCRLQVRTRLAAGGKRIRTIGPARRKAVVPKREHPRAASRSLPGRPQTISARTTVRQPAIRSSRRCLARSDRAHRQDISGQPELPDRPRSCLLREHGRAT